MSTLKVDNLETTGGAGLYPAIAWVNFNGTGTVSIRAAGNVGSITDNGTGNYTANLDNAASSSNYAAVVSGKVALNDGMEASHFFVGSSRTTTTLRLLGASSTAETQDKAFFELSVFL